MSIIGTHHFVSFAAAQRYYVSQAYCTKQDSNQVVKEKIKEGAIVVGVEPEVKPGERVVIDTVEGRYVIDDGKP